MEEARKAINQRMLVLVHGVFQVRSRASLPCRSFKLDLGAPSLITNFQSNLLKQAKECNIRAFLAIHSYTTYTNYAHLMYVIAGTAGCWPAAVPALQATHYWSDRYDLLCHELLHAPPCLPEAGQVKGAIGVMPSLFVGAAPGSSEQIFLCVLRDPAQLLEQLYH